MKISLKLLTPESEIEKRILKAIEKHLSIKIGSRSITSKIEKFGSQLIESAIESSATVRSLSSGELKGEIGDTNSEQKINTIIQHIVSSVIVTVQRPKIRGTSIHMRLRFSAVPADLSGFSSIGSYTTEKGVVIPWFDWLTSLGDRVIVRDYQAEAGHSKSSRTGDKIMVKGQGWRVPPEHAGVPDNNFITKATEDILPDLGKFIQKTIQAAI